MIRVLLVDPDDQDRDRVAAALEAHGYEVDVAQHGAKALSVANQTPPQLVVSEVLMPEIGGYGLLHHFRSNERLRDIPFIIHTTLLSEVQGLHLAPRFAADALIAKSGAPDALLACIPSVIAARQRGHDPASSDFAGSDLTALTSLHGMFIRLLEEKLLHQDALTHQVVAEQTHLRAIIDNVPECVKLLAADGSLLDMNPAGLRMIEADSLQQLRNRSIYVLIAEEDRAAFRQLNKNVMRGTSGMLEFSIVGLKGRRLRMETHASPLHGASGEISSVLAITRDVTERRLAEQILADAHRRLRVAVEGSNTGLWDWDLRTNEVYFSNIWKRQLGYEEHEISNRFEEWQSRVHPDDIALAMATVQRYLATPHGDYENRFRLRHKDGSYRYIVAKASLVFDEHGQKVRLVGSHLDLTEKHRIEQEVRSANDKLRSLSQRLVNAQEDEQRRLSTELHDRVGQNLTALSINLGIIGAAMSAESRDKVWSRLDDSRALLEATIADVRDVISNLRPVVLDDYGLLAGLRWHAEQVQQRTGIRITVSGDESAARLNPDVELGLFRIAQEALANVTKHAHAQRAWVILGQGDQQVRLTISDDGAGFDSERIVHSDSQSHLGLIAMQERANALSGNLSVHSAPGEGTRVVIDVPHQA